MSNNTTFSHRYSAILIFTAMAIAAFVYHSCNNRKAMQQWNNSGIVWTTEYHITYEATRDLNDSVQAILRAVDNSVSPFNKASLISAINSNSTDSTDRYFRLLYNTSAKINAKSNGAFDPTVMPLVNAWGFGYKSGNLPTDAQIDSILQFIGFGKTRLEHRRIVKQDPRTQFDFSSIAKGMACDEIGAMLLRNGARNYLVEIGGEIASRGTNTQGKPWRVSVDAPIESNTEVVHESALVLQVNTSGIATSGNYRNYKVVDGRKISHTVNPVTGQPEQSNLLSATIVAENCMTADAWATAAMVMGLDKTRSMMEKNDSLGVMLISARTDGAIEVWSNAAFAKLVVTE